MAPSPTRRGLLATVGGAANLGLAGCSDLADGNGTPANPTETATGSPTEGETVADSNAVVSLGVIATDTDYAVLGSEDASQTAKLYGGWKCPYTKEFVDDMFPPIVDEYVAPGDLTVEFRAVRFQADESWGDDEPRANRAGLAVWHEAPEQFPAYVETLYSNQPSEQTEWATVEKLVGFAEQAGIEETQPIEESITAGEHAALWKDTMDVVEEKGIEGIPRFELGGEITAPILNPDPRNSNSSKRSCECVSPPSLPGCWHESATTQCKVNGSFSAKSQ